MDDFSVRAIASRANDYEFQKFAQSNQRFILKCASIATGRLITISDDEWSVALIAFYEAVRTYDESKGAFKAFSRMVIKRRLQDHYYKEKRHFSEIMTAPESFDGGVDPEEASAYELAVSRASNELVGDNTAPSSLKNEVEAIGQRLEKYGFSLFELGKCSPKIARTKRGCGQAVRYILDSPDRVESLRRTKSLPFTELLKLDYVTKKILDRHRKYIIAAVEIIDGDFPLLAEYISKIKDYV